MFWFVIESILVDEGAFLIRSPINYPMKYFWFALCVSFPFTISAQTSCDSLDFVSIQYSPFTGTVLIVEVENNNQNEIFGYPGFVLLDANDDTLAVEAVDYFGIGQESVHRLNVKPVVHDPLQNFDGTLELHTGFYNQLVCEWDINQSLCADSPCDSLIIALQNWGGALVVGDFRWRVDDEDGMLVDSGSFYMEAQGQYWSKGLCVEPGLYSYSLTALGDPSGGGPNLTASSSTAFSSPTIAEPLNWFNNPGATLEIPFFTFCASSPNSINDLGAEDLPTLQYNPTHSLLNCSEKMSLIQVLSASGRLIHCESPSSKTVTIPKLTSGIYIAVAVTEKGECTLKFVLN